MTSNERWEKNYESVMSFMKQHRRRPSKHRVEEHRMLNWMKFNKKKFLSGALPPYRSERFKKLLVEAQRLQRLNQYAYVPWQDEGQLQFTFPTP